MSKGPQRIRGTQDIWGEDADRFGRVVEAFDKVRRLYGFQRIELPVFEATQVFARSIGETTDIVSKEMYSLEDRGGESLTLRPEFTAGICRAFLSEGWQQHVPMKVATHGPVFRYERPQKGRYRQFHQLDAEILGSDSPLADVELLVFADQLLKELGISEGVTLQLNTLGDADTRAGWQAALIAYFEGHRDQLSDDSRVRLEKNPLRILDSKDVADRILIRDAPQVDDYLSGEAGYFFDRVQAGLDAAGVEFERNARLVRGLDYYRHTAFEFVTDQLGAQGTVLAGGRYDGLMEALGGGYTPAIGWAAGIERLAMMIEAPSPERVNFAIVVEDDAINHLGQWAAAALRRGGISCQLISEGSQRKRFDKAVKLQPDSILIFNTVLLEEGQLANMRIKRLVSGRRASERENSVLGEALTSKFRIQRLTTNRIDSGADVKIYERPDA
ncbi:MAG TPA: histidine--tRNA ligase [Allosphingosinicella sp.]|jgi:histidyl-tRNA synthetase